MHCALHEWWSGSSGASRLRIADLEQGFRSVSTIGFHEIHSVEKISAKIHSFVLAICSALDSIRFRYLLVPASLTRVVVPLEAIHTSR